MSDRQPLRIGREKPSLRTLPRDLGHHLREEWQSRTWYGKLWLPYEVLFWGSILSLVAIPLLLLGSFMWWMNKLEAAGGWLKSLFPPIYEEQR